MFVGVSMFIQLTLPGEQGHPFRLFTTSSRAFAKLGLPLHSCIVSMLMPTLLANLLLIQCKA